MRGQLVWWTLRLLQLTPHVAAALSALSILSGSRKPRCLPRLVSTPRAAEAGKLEGVHISPSLDSALQLLSSGELAQRVETVFVIGGGQVRAAACSIYQNSAFLGNSRP